MRILTFLLFCLALPSSLFAASAAEWRRDIDQIVADIRATHPNPFEMVGELRFLREADRFKRDLALLSEEQRVARAMALVALLSDGHTILEPEGGALALWYPVRIYEFTDGYFITGAHQSVRDLAGAQIVEVGGRSVEQAVAAARTLQSADNALFARERLHAFHNSSLMRALGFANADGSLTLRLRLPGRSESESRTLRPMQGESSTLDWVFRPEFWGAVGEAGEWISAYRGLTAAQLRTPDPNRPLHLADRRTLHAQPVPGGDAYYIQVNAMGGTPQETLPAFFKRALAEVDQLKPKRLIIDLRYNFGGDGSNVPAIIDELMSRKKSPPWQELYVITGRRTYSAAILFLDALIDHLQPTLIGEPPGAPLNHYGDANTFRYPVTGLRMYVSFERHQSSKSTDLRPFIAVDYPASFRSDDYAGGRDPAIDPILKAEERRSIVAIAAKEGAARAREIYRERERLFAGHPAWHRPSEPELRAVVRTLLDAGRFDEAIDVATLNTEINPEEWRTWYNLGAAQIRAGRQAAGIESYRKTLALNDPTNFNTDRLRRLVAEADASAKAAPAPQPR